MKHQSLELLQDRELEVRQIRRSGDTIITLLHNDADGQPYVNL